LLLLGHFCSQHLTDLRVWASIITLSPPRPPAPPPAWYCSPQKNKEKETASVQLLGEDMRIETVSLDDIAEFVGRQDDMLD